MIYNGKKYYHVFTAGNYTQANITEDDLMEISSTYDPVNFHEAPVWLGHPNEQEGDCEPEALAWIDSVMAVGNKLYVSFAYISDKMKQLIESQAFKRVSVEIVKYNTDDGKQFLYLYAVGLTNRPAVKGLEPISFSGHKSNPKFTERLAFNEKFINHNNQTMNQYLIKVAESVGLDISKFTTDSSLQEAINLKFNELKAEAEKKPEPAPAPADNPAVAELQSKLDLIEEERIADLVDSAVRDFKILPAHKDTWKALAKSNFKIAKASIENMSVHKDLADKVIKPGQTSGSIDFSDKKFTNANGQKITYKDYLSMEDSDQNMFTDEEVAELRKSSF